MEEKEKEKKKTNTRRRRRRRRRRTSINRRIKGNITMAKRSTTNNNRNERIVTKHQKDG